MAVTINADTSNGLVLTPDTSGEIKLQSAGTDTVTVDTSGNVGIGNSSPMSSESPTLTLGHATVIGDVVSDQSLFGNNIYYNSGWKYYTTADYAAIRLQNQSITFHTGPSASAGSSASNMDTTDAKMTVNINGRVLVGHHTELSSGKFQTYATGSFSHQMYQDYTTGTGYFIEFLRTTGTFGSVAAVVGTITASTTNTSYNTSSDYRLKNNVTPMSGSIDRLKQLKPSTWSWVQDGSHGEGFLAHEAQAVVPEAVTGTKDAVDDEGNPVYQGIDQSKLVPLLTAALQEAITKIEDLETRIQALENS